MGKEKSKPGARPPPSRKPQYLLKKGDWLDVLDADGVWNVAQVLSVPSPYKVKITYDGWPKDYDEVVSIDSHRVAPYNTFTWTVKCWVKYLNWPLWPSLVTIRSPGTKAGITNLAVENRLFVDFLDNPSFVKRDRCWQKKTQVRPFDKNYDRKRTGSTGESFERALGWVLQSNASLMMPTFDAGTLPIEYKLSPAKSVETIRKRMEDEQWFLNFTHSQMRHQMNHVYETIGSKEDKNTRKDFSTPPMLDESMFSQPGQPQVVNHKKKKRPVGVRMDQDPRSEKEMLYEIEPLNISDDSDTGDVHDTVQPKKRCLQTKRKSDGLSNTRKVEQGEPRHSDSPRVTSKKRTQSVAQPVVKNAKANHSKGPTKKAVRRKPLSTEEHISAIARIELSSDTSEVSETQSTPIAAQAGTVSKRPGAGNRTKKSKKNGLNAAFDHISEQDAAIMFSVRPEAMNELTKKKKKALGPRKHLAAGKASKKEQVGSNGHSLPSTSSQDTFQLISPCVSKQKSRRPRLSNLNALRRAEMTMETTPGSSKHAKEVDCSFVFATRMVSSDNDERKGSFDENTARNYFSEGNGRMHEDADKHSTFDDGGSQELRRRFCVMQADQEDVTETVKCSKKTVISVPRKFSEVSVRHLPTCFTDSPVGNARRP